MIESYYFQIILYDVLRNRIEMEPKRGGAESVGGNNPKNRSRSGS